MVTFNINISPMLAYIPYMDPMGYGILSHAIGLTILPLPCAAEKTTAIYFFSTRRSRRDTGVCPPCAPLTCRCKSSAVTKPRPQAHEKGHLQPRRHGIPRPSEYPSKWIKNVLYHAMVVLLQFLGGTWYMCLHLVKFLAITKSMIEHIAKMGENATSGNSLKTNKGKSQPFFSS